MRLFRNDLTYLQVTILITEGCCPITTQPTFIKQSLYSSTIPPRFVTKLMPFWLLPCLTFYVYSQELAQARRRCSTDDTHPGCSANSRLCTSITLWISNTLDTLSCPRKISSSSLLWKMYFLPHWVCMQRFLFCNIISSLSSSTIVFYCPSFFMISALISHSYEKRVFYSVK